MTTVRNTGNGKHDGQPDRDSAPEFRHYLGVLRRRIWAVATVLIIVVTLGTVQAFKSPPVYRAQARILIERELPQAVNFEEVVQPGSSDRSYYNTQAALLRSRNVIEKALQQPGMQELFEADTDAGPSLLAEARRTISALLGTRPATPPAPWERLRDVVGVEQVRDTHLLLVGVERREARQAALIANAVAKAFEQYHLERRKEASNDAFAFLNRQTGEQEQKLSGAENSLQQFREQVRIVSLDVQEADNPILARLRRLSEELTGAQMRRISLESELRVVDQAAGSGRADLDEGWHGLLAVGNVRTDPAISAIRTGLVDAEKEAIALQDTYGAGHPQSQNAQAKVALLQESLASALTLVAGSLRPELQMLADREQELRRQYEEQNQQALELARHSLTYARLQSDVDRQRRLFDVLVERMREVDLSADYGKTNVEVVEAAEPPNMPIRPRKARMVLMSVVLGLLVGVGLAFFFEHMDDTVKTPEDMEDRVGVPVLGFVPAMSGNPNGKESFAYRGLLSAIEPTSSVSEAYRNIRTSLFFAAPADDAKAIVVTSGGPGDGKTTTAANLALVIAQSGKRVLLMDADFRRPMLHKVFGLSGRKGLTTVLVGESTLEEAVQKASHDGRPLENLDVLVAGPKPPNPAELLDSQNMRRLLQEARGRYDRVIMDTPPVLFVADATILSGISDGVIMVVKSAKNTRSVAGRARQHLESVNARILGGVLNEVRMARLGSRYSDYYHYGYGGHYRDYYGSYYGREDEQQDAA